MTGSTRRVTPPTAPRRGMAHFLGAAGFDVWLADLRHHGDSAREPRRGAWTFEDWVLHVPRLSHRGLVVSERARTNCWPNVVAWLRETL